MIVAQQIRVGVLALLLCAAAFSAGRFSAPVEVEERYDVEVRWRERVVERVVTVKAKDRIVYVERTVKPDGTVHERSETREQEREHATRDTERSQEAQTKESSVKTVTVQPKWRVGLTTGATLRDPLIPIAGPLVIGVQIDHRIVGGLSAGIWASSYGAAGVSLSMEF